MKKTKRISICLLALASFAAGCASAAHATSEHRVVVIYPEQWLTGEYRNCSPSAELAVYDNKSTLDCDLQSHETPRSRMFIMDVRFSGKYKPPETMTGQAWTCEKDKETVICRR